MPILSDLAHSIFPLLGVAGTAFWIWMLVDCFNRPQARAQRGWMLFLMFITGWLGALIYFMIYVFPPTSFLHRSWQQTTPAPNRPPVYYMPLQQTPPPPYQGYQEGYQPQNTASPSATPSSQTQTTSMPLDYDEPQATYQELPPQQM